MRNPETRIDREIIRDLSEDLVNGEMIPVGGITRKVSIDSRGDLVGSLFIGISGEKQDGSRFAGEALDNGAWGVVVAPSYWEMAREKAVNKKRIAFLAKDPLYFLGELARGKRRSMKNVLFTGITGSTGKTTTKDMVAAILSSAGRAYKNPGNFNNLVGLPLSLLMVRGSDRYGVLEIGTNTPGEVARLTSILSPQTGTITNIGPAHLEGFGGIDGVQKEKGDLFLNMSEDAVAVVNRDDLRVFTASKSFSGNKVYFGESEGDVTGRILHMKPQSMGISILYGEDLIEVDLNYPGIQFFRNVLCAAGVAFALGIPSKSVEEGLSRFVLASGRFVIHSLAGDIIVVDDSYNANPLSAEVAVENIMTLFPDKKKIFVMGDMLELGESTRSSHMRLGAILANADPYLIFTCGESARHIAEGASSSGFPRDRCFNVQDPLDLGEMLAGELVENSVILVKGSRMMRLEKVVEKLLCSTGAKGETA